MQEAVNYIPPINTGILVLAAGRSSRLGRPKQLLVFENRTLLKHTIQAAESSIAGSVAVVLGAYSAAVASETVGDRSKVVLNPRWEEGISSSVRCGLSALVEEDPTLEGIVLMVCDQPYITADLINRLVETHLDTGKKIIASAYAETYGPPVFFHQSYFHKLLELTGDSGGKGLILSNLSDLVSVNFPEGSIDIDTEADYHKILKRTDD